MSGLNSTLEHQGKDLKELNDEVLILLIKALRHHSLSLVNFGFCCWLHLVIAEPVNEVRCPC